MEADTWRSHDDCSFSTELKAAMGLSEEERARPTYDEYTSEELPPNLEAAGKQEELKYFASKDGLESGSSASSSGRESNRNEVGVL